MSLKHDAKIIGIFFILSYRYTHSFNLMPCVTCGSIFIFYAKLSKKVTLKYFCTYLHNNDVYVSKHSFMELSNNYAFESIAVFVNELQTDAKCKLCNLSIVVMFPLLVHSL